MLTEGFGKSHVMCTKHEDTYIGSLLPYNKPSQNLVPWNNNLLIFSEFSGSASSGFFAELLGSDNLESFHDIVTHKKYIFGPSDNQNIFFTYICSSSMVPAPQLPKDLEFPKLEEQWEHLVSYL